MINTKAREQNRSMTCFDKIKTLVSCMPKNNKQEIVLHYNRTKSELDSFNRMCWNVSCSRNSRTLPFCIFYGMINAACINPYVF